MFRNRDSQVVYLVVSSSDGANWVLPKGHIDPGETPEMAALRELAEEAGVVGEIVAQLSAKHFRKADKELDVQYFLIRATSETARTDGRTPGAPTRQYGSGHASPSRSTRWAASRGMSACTAASIWPATPGNGARIGTIRTTTHPVPRPTRKVRNRLCHLPSISIRSVRCAAAQPLGMSPGGHLEG